MDTIRRYSDLAGTELVAVTSYGYDEWANVASIETKDALNETISSFDYEWDAARQLVSQLDYQALLDETPFALDYTYDFQGQLTGNGEDEWSYDPSGNRDAYTFNENYTNQLESDGVWDYVYDDEGNMTGKEEIGTSLAWSYYFDHANHLVKAERRTNGTDVDLEVDFKYDPYGGRVEKIVDDDGAGANPATVMRFALDGGNPLKPSPIGTENWDVFADLDGSNDLMTRYLRGDVVDQLFARVDAEGQFWLTGDYLGSTRDVLDDNGAVVMSARYASFGGIAAEDGAGQLGRYQWTGREIDAEIELQFNRARYYDPTIGRWISEDPIGFDAGDSNLYRYVGNRAIASDPSGLALLVIASEANAFKGIFEKLKLFYRATPTPDYKYYYFDISMNSEEVLGKAERARIVASETWNKNMIRAAGARVEAVGVHRKIEDATWGLYEFDNEEVYKVNKSREGTSFLHKTFGHRLAAPFAPFYIFDNAIWANLQQGCIGLTRARLGLDPGNVWRSANFKAAFLDFQDADAYLKSLKRANARMFAYQWQGGWVDGKAPSGRGPIDFTTFAPLANLYNYATLHRPKGEEPYWESMNHNLHEPDPHVRHWRTLNSEAVYPFTLYGVVLATNKTYTPLDYIAASSAP